MNKLTVFFENPFWVGVFEKSEEGKLEICRVVFGQEPKDWEVYNFVLKNYYKLKFSKSISIDEVYEEKCNPKKMQREIKKTISQSGIGTKAQQAIKLDYENKKVERKIISREKREIEGELKFKKRQEKKLQKKRGH